MKHNLKVIFILVLLFILSQYIGLLVTHYYLAEPELPLDIERPDIAPQFSFIYIAVMIIVITILLLILTKFKFSGSLIKVWFLISIWFTLTISFAAFISEGYAVILAIILGLLKVYRPNQYTHNFPELFIYGALATILVPIMNVTSAIILLLIISIYDYIAVRKTKHMVKLAKSQSKLKIFTGLLIPYGKRVAMLGGGDIGFPLLFVGTILQKYGNIAFILPLIITGSLFLLFYYGKNKKFYPAMPYLTAGCLVGYSIVRILLLI